MRMDPRKLRAFYYVGKYGSLLTAANRNRPGQIYIFDISFVSTPVKAFLSTFACSIRARNRLRSRLTAV